MLPRTPFWYLRHGQTDFNARGLAQGATDIPLNETGRTQARHAAEFLSSQTIAAIVASPLLRARETAAIVNETLKLPVSFEAELREVSYGAMEGQPLLPWFPDWVEGRATPEGAESFADLALRVNTILETLLVRPGPLLIVAHGAVFRAARTCMSQPREMSVPNAQPIHCKPIGETAWNLSMFHEN